MANYKKTGKRRSDKKRVGKRRRTQRKKGGFPSGTIRTLSTPKNTKKSRKYRKIQTI